MSRDHRKLKAFHTADALVLEVYQVTRDLPDSERFGLQAQIRRAAVSTVTNIVEGSARSSTREYCRFLNVGHGSAREAGYLLGLSVRLGFLKRDAVSMIIERYERLEATLGAIVSALEASDKNDRVEESHAQRPKPRAGSRKP